jgi:hypothetical protein
MKITPNVPFCGLCENSISLIKDKLLHAKGWDPLVGNNNSDRMYYPNLQKNVKLYKVIQDAVKWYLSEIKDKYPSLTISSLGLLKSAPNAQSQYDGCSQRLHSDYPSDVNLMDIQLRSLSFIIALDEFDFMWLPHCNAKRSQIQTEIIKPGQMIVFTNNCQHAGGSNRQNQWSFRIFGYVCSRPTDIPLGMVFPCKWSSTEDDAVVVEDSSNERFNSESTSGRKRAIPDRYIPNKY